MIISMKYLTLNLQRSYLLIYTEMRNFTYRTEIVNIYFINILCNYIFIYNIMFLIFDF